ncbi:hypothetical protein [Burkholderia ubonensis]|uniref:hypothetical protein n=1 Tax=Burkholderia ubonensis TaxID=101571 RepID=UPI0012F79873|nr:hypothetical protein [Burkholderia ubonensis]
MLIAFPLLSANYFNFPFWAYSASLRKTFSFDEGSILLPYAKTESTDPLHIINCCLHSTLSKNADTRERGGCNFFVTRLHCGSNETGNYHTQNWRMLSRKAPHLDIWRLAATSGAAIEGHGVRQSPLTNALLSLANIGLGQWVINPSSAFNVRKGVPSLLLNFFAALGARMGTGTWIRLSDGGHFENLGIYELVRRRCRKIIVVDAAHDPKFKFVDLARASAVCYADFGAEIELPELSHPGIHNQGKCVYRGAVRYSDGVLAELIYIKLTIGVMHPLRLRVRASFDKRFPHEPTKNQQVTRDFINSYFDAGLCAARQAFPG